MHENIPVTEQINERTIDIDKKNAYEIAKLINEEDKTVPYVVEKVLKEISRVIDIIAQAIKDSGRLIYIGSGTSGRLGVIDAAECPPTYGVKSEVVQGIIAGGMNSMYRASETSEDNYSSGAEDLKKINFSSKDICFGISANGNTPYVLGAIDYANSIGAYTIALCCNENTEMSKRAKLTIAPIVGPEVIAGSTRMKAATAQKLVLNTISTGVMVLLGRTYGNSMLYLKPNNSKLFKRAARIIAEIKEIDTEEAEKVLKECNGDVEACLNAIEKGDK